jgi:RNA polymerase sigma-70 factor (ECF subfamily)
MKPGAVRTRDEVDDAIQNLSDAGWSRLRKVAAAYARGRPIEAEDLLHEAFRRAIDGGRHCPTHVDVVKFLAEAMRSIAHGEAEKLKSRPRLVPIANHGGAEDAPDPPDPAMDPEQSLASTQDAGNIKSALLALFDDDETAQIILEGTMERMPREELRELTELDKTAYESKRRLIRRRIDKRFPKGWTS